MKRFLSLGSLLLCLATPALAAAPTVSTPQFANLGASQATLTLRSDATGTGYFVLLSGGGVTAPSGAQAKAGQDSTGAPADRRGSVPLTANTDASCTVRSLEANTTYTIFFTADDGTTLQSTCASASFSTAPAVDLTGFEWAVVSAAGFSAGGVQMPDLAFAPDGTPYVVYREGSINSYKATVMSLQSGAWAPVGGVGFTAGRGDEPSLAFAPDGTPYVAFSDFSGNPDGRATVMKYSGGSWTAVGAARFSSGSINRISLAFAPNGQPWVVFQDQDHSGFGTVMQYTGSGWTLVGTAGAAPSPVTNRAIGFAFDGTPVVAGMRTPDSHATLMKFNGTDWEDVTGGFGLSTGIGNDVCLAFSPYGEPHVAFSDSGASSKVVVKKFDGTAWTQLGDTGSASNNAGMLSIETGGDAAVYVSFKANATSSNATVMKYHGSAWSTVGRARISAGVVDGTSVALAPDGTPYVAFGDYANGNSDGCRETVMKMTPPPPTLTTPSFTNLGANQVTLTLQASVSGRGYFTLLPGASATAGTGAQTKAGLDSTGATAFRSGSLPLAANTAATYTIQNLTANAAYTVCFTADNGSSLQGTCATASFTTNAATDLTGGVWVAPFPTRFSSGGASELSMAFTASGAPAIAMRDLGPDYPYAGKASVMTYNGSAWVNIGSAGFSRSTPNDCNIAISPTGQLYVAYADYGDSVSDCNYATVMTYNGSAWVPVAAPRFTPDVAGDVSLAISPHGVPWIAFREPNNSFKLAVMSFNGTTWTGEGSSLSDGSAGDVKLAFAPDGTPYVAFRDDARSSRASVLRLQGGSWSYVGSAGFTSGTSGAYFLSLAFAPNGTPYLAFADYSNGAKACVKRFDGSAWVDVGTPDFSPSSATYLSLAFDPSGNPWVSFCDQISGSYEASVMAFDGTSWGQRGDRGISAGGTTYSPLAFAPDGTPYIAFGDSPDGKLSVKRLQIPVAPTVVSVDVPAAGAYAVDSYLEFTINFSTTVDVVMLPYIGLTIGSQTQYASYYFGGGTTALKFRYKVQSGDSGSVSVKNTPIGYLSGGSIKSALDGADAVTTLNNVGSTTGVTAGAPAAPTLTTPTTTNLGANQVTLQLRSSATGTGYFTILPGASATSGTGAQVKAGRDASNVAAFRFGSLPLTANTTTSYTIGNLVAGTAYTVCFTADDGTTLQSAPVTTSFTTSSSVALSGLNWAQIGTVLSAAAADYDGLAFAPDGTPYVAFQDYDLARKITVKRFDGTNWVTVGTAGFSGAAADFISLAIAPNGTPYVAYKDDAQSFKATVMRFNGSAWTVVGTAGFSAGQACDESLAFAPDGTPYLAYRDVANSEKATVMKFDGSAWNIVGSVGFTPGTAYEVSLAFSPLGQPHVAYRDMANAGKVSVMKWDGTAWANVGLAGFSDGTGYPARLRFAPDGTPYLAFQDAAHALKATVMKFTGGAWANVGPAGFTAAAAGNVSLAFGANNAPYLGFTDASVSSKTSVMTFNGTAWVAVGNTGISTGTAGFASLAIAPNGRPWIAFKDNGSSGQATVMNLSGTPPGTTPTITWSAPAAITYGTALSATQLNATATDGLVSVPGTFVYTPPAGTVLNAGASQTLNVAFTPTDLATYTTASGTTNIAVNKANQTITFAVLSDRTIGDGSFTLGASASSGLTVSYVSSNAAVATVSGNTVTIVGAGSTNITASQAGNTNYNPASAVMRTLNVSDMPSPEITTDPVSRNVTEGDTVTFTVAASGSDLTYEWRKDDVEITGAYSSTLTLTNVTLGAAGRYTAIVSNSGGWVASAPAVLTVAPRLPAVTTPPQSQLAAYGSSVSFTVAASGTGPFTYQWYKDNVAIAGATGATLTLNPVRPNTGGLYTVAVTNAAGTIRSNAATLNVGPRGLLRAYLGTFGAADSAGARGKFGLYVRDDGSAVFLAYEVSGRLGFIVRNVQLDASRHFQFATQPVNPLAVKAAHVARALTTNDTVVDATIGADGSITGSFSGAITAPLRADEPSIVVNPADVTGFYEAGVAGTSSSSYFIVNEARQAFALTVHGGAADSATGTIDALGRFAFTTETQGAISGAIDCRAATLTTTVTAASGESRLCEGGNKDVRSHLERMINVSGRGSVSSADPLIAGFVVKGTQPKRVLIRGVGPSLANFGVAAPLGAARLEVFQSGKSIASGQDWHAAANASDVAAAAAMVGAFPLAADSHDAAVLLMLQPGAYTAVVSGEGAATGVAVAEVYDATEGAIGPAERVINISTRARVGTGDAALFSGFVINGDVPKRLLIRGAGASLSQFGIANPLTRPELTLWSGQTVVARNTSWSTNPDAAAIALAGADANTFPLGSGEGDAALLIYLEPGSYCVQISGAGGATGVAIAEVYELP